MKDKLNILILNWQDIKNPLGGGAEVHLHEIFSRIAKMGHYVKLISCESVGLPENEIIDEIDVTRKGSRSLFNYYVPGLVKDALKAKDFDIIIDDINKIPFYTPIYIKSKPLLAISHHFFGKSIYREANIIAGSYVYFSEFVVNFIYKHTPFSVVSQSTLDEFTQRGFDTSRFSIVTNAITQENFPMKVCEKSKSPTVTYFGRLKKYKSVDHLFSAFAILKENMPDAKLEIIGRGDFRPYLEKLSDTLGIADSVIFHGFVSEDDKSKILSRSHIIVNTSMKEGWGITNIEANACGTPVISADVPGLRDSVSVGKSGLLYEYGNIKELAAKMTNVLQNKRLFEELCNGAVRWAETFSWDKSAGEMLEVIYNTINQYNSKENQGK
ncbi:MAG: glycosyltransferase family 4 protein [Candidatus Kapabacteria bacterium]|nr:glycosyltransferase family 4 protein [Ignavibacteriota bacterium]MCW5885161.1 glycosyltransferase family 4 protein [Candidatus Kapabacteria bacterium]